MGEQQKLGVLLTRARRAKNDEVADVVRSILPYTTAGSLELVERDGDTMVRSQYYALWNDDGDITVRKVSVSIPLRLLDREKKKWVKSTIDEMTKTLEATPGKDADGNFIVHITTTEKTYVDMKAFGSLAKFLVAKNICPDGTLADKMSAQIHAFAAMPPGGFLLHAGKDLLEAYVRFNSNGLKSCMTGAEHTPTLALYAENPESVGVAEIENEGVNVARCLVWGNRYFDRMYGDATKGTAILTKEGLKANDAHAFALVMRAVNNPPPYFDRMSTAAYIDKGKKIIVSSPKCSAAFRDKIGQLAGRTLTWGDIKGTAAGNLRYTCPVSGKKFDNLDHAWQDGVMPFLIHNSVEKVKTSSNLSRCPQHGMFMSSAHPVTGVVDIRPQWWEDEHGVFGCYGESGGLKIAFLHTAVELGSGFKIPVLAKATSMCSLQVKVGSAIVGYAPDICRNYLPLAQEGGVSFITPIHRGGEGDSPYLAIGTILEPSTIDSMLEKAGLAPVKERKKASKEGHVAIA